MNRALAGVLLAAPIWVLGQDPSNSLLWSISGQGLTAPSYVYGTVHSKDERAYTFSYAVEEAMRGVNSVAGELDFKNDTRTSLALMSLMMMPDGQRLEDLYSKKHWKEVDAALRERLGPMASMVMRMKPFFVMAMLADAGMANHRPEVLDAYLMEVARDSGKKVFGLETVKEQFAAIDAMPVKEQAQALRAHLRMDSAAELDELLDAYAEQDLEVLMKLMSESPSMPSALQKSLIIDRNQVMAHRMDSVLVADGPSFFMVGAGHLPGATGVLKLLADRGYVVEPMVVLPNSLAPRFPPAILLKDGIRYSNDSLGFSVDLPGFPDAGMNEQSASHWMLHVNEPSREINVAISSDVLKPTQEELGFDALISKEFSVDAPLEISVVDQQGLEARSISFEANGRGVSTLVIKRGGSLFMLVVISLDPASRKAIMDSLHFTDLPE